MTANSRSSHCSARLRDQGYAIIENLVSPGLIEALNADFDAHFACQPARKTDPLSAPNIDPTFRQRGGYPGSR